MTGKHFVYPGKQEKSVISWPLEKAGQQYIRNNGELMIISMSGESVVKGIKVKILCTRWTSQLAKRKEYIALLGIDTHLKCMWRNKLGKCGIED